jgi:four helix bundle protein
VSATFETLHVLQSAEQIADSIWKRVVSWDDFPKDAVGKQLTRAADSIGANIAEAYGRFHFGEKLQFLYFARGSVFETKYWLNRVLRRGLMPVDDVQEYATKITSLARQLNAFASSLRTERTDEKQRTAKEYAARYFADISDDLIQIQLFNDEEITRLES